MPGAAAWGRGLVLAMGRGLTAFLPSFTATSGSTLRLATCRGCVTCWPLSWSSWMMVSGWGGSLGVLPRPVPAVHPWFCVCAAGRAAVCVCCWHGHVGCRCCGARAAEHRLCVPRAEALAFSCFTELMKRMNQNFPHGGAMDTHFANMRSLIQVGRQHGGSSLSGQ